MISVLRILPLPFALGIALFAGKRGRISVATIVSVVGIALGVATLTAVLAVTSGFEKAFKERILGVHPHIIVMARGDFSDYEDVSRAIEKVPGVVGANPSTYDQMMISADAGTAGVSVKGVDLEGVDKVSGLRTLMKVGTVKDLKYLEGQDFKVAVGCGLYKRLRLKPGDRVTLVSPIRGIEGRTAGPLGMAPMQEAFVVIGCFDTGFHEYDSRLVVMDLKAAQAFLNRGPAVRWIEVKLGDMENTEEAKRQILAHLEPFTLFDLLRDFQRLQKDLTRLIQSYKFSATPNIILAVAFLQKALFYSDYGSGPPRRFRAIDWKQMNKNLFSALRIQKVVLALFFLIIVVVAAFNIVGTQVVVARERLKDISTLVALGASRRLLYKVFLAHGMILGSAGVCLGLLLGLLITGLIKRIDYPLDPTVYQIARLPADIGATEALTVALLSMVVVFASCLMSSLKAIRVDPIEGLRKLA